jgi:hypothetical protein
MSFRPPLVPIICPAINNEITTKSTIDLHIISIRCTFALNNTNHPLADVKQQASLHDVKRRTDTGSLKKR